MDIAVRRLPLVAVPHTSTSPTAAPKKTYAYSYVIRVLRGHRRKKIRLYYLAFSYPQVNDAQGVQKCALTLVAEESEQKDLNNRRTKNDYEHMFIDVQDESSD